jgi:hypothetical protein
MNNNQRGRPTGMPGTETTVTLYPQRLGVRMRNTIIRMLERGIIEGCWSSKSRQLAEALASKYGLSCSLTNSYRGLRVIGVTQTAAPLVAEIVQADWAAWLLEEPEYRNGYYQRQYSETMKSLKQVDGNFWVSLMYKESTSKVIEILIEHTTQEVRDKAMQVANMLRGTEPIHITTFRS